MFGIEQLEAFVATVDAGSFSSAARVLGKAQSVVSQHIMNLEIDCGVELFDRHGRYPVLTEHGTKLLSHARATLLQHKRLQHTASTLFLNQPSEICIALDEGIPVHNILPTMQQLAQQFPDIQLELLSASSKDIIDMVESGRATTGLVFSELDIPHGIDFECIGAVKFDIFVAATHPLGASVAAHMDILRLHRQLLIRSRNVATSSFQQAISPDIWYADNYYILLELTVEGYGWCLLPEHIAESAVKSGKLVRVPTEFERLGWLANIDVIQHQRHSSLPIYQQLRFLLREQIG